MTSSTSSLSKKIIVFGGTGAIGRHLINRLVKEQPTWQIFAVSRSTTTDKFENLPNVEVVQGDPHDKIQVMTLSADKDIVYACVGFSRYEVKYWAEHWPIVVDNLLFASSQKPHQKLVFCDNLYAYGATTDINPKTPTMKPSTSTKPGVRALIRAKLQARMTESPKSIAVVGGADFFGPFVTSNSFLGDTFTKVILQGSPAPICVGSKSAIHDFCYAPDFARALYIVSVSTEADGQFWICPHTVHGKTMQEIASDVARLANSKNNKVTAYPGWSVRLLSPFVGFMKEMRDMLPFWTKDYTVNDSDFVQTFGIEATPYEQALQEYIDFYKSLAAPTGK